jgi:hypothetical protein
LPDLLIKHLRLAPQQGVRISNVQRNSPADRAGLERDDIIIGFEGETINDFEQLVDTVQETGVGAEVSLGIIHLGERKTVNLQLEALEDEPELKYIQEPQIFQSWRPGKLFRFKPGDKDWIEMELPFDGKLFEVYEYHHSDDREDCLITIEGDPEDENTKITVRIGPDEYNTTIGEIDKLPEKFRVVAEDTLKKSKKHSGQRKKIMSRKFSLPSMVKPDELDKYLKKLDGLNKHLKERSRVLVPPDLPRFGPDNKIFDKIEKQMQKMQERIEELEKRFGETPENSSGEPDKDQI